MGTPLGHRLAGAGVVHDDHVPQGVHKELLRRQGLGAGRAVLLFGVGIAGVQVQQVGVLIGLAGAAGLLVADVLVENQVDGGIRVGGLGAVLGHTLKLLSGRGRGGV